MAPDLLDPTEPSPNVVADVNGLIAAAEQTELM